MAQPVWVLSVDLQTKTATFTTGLADAAKKARTAFKDIKDGAADMGDGVSRGSFDVRHALGLVDNTIRGAHTMAMADLIRMFKDSALVMGALPFAMTVAGFALVAEMVMKGVQAYEAMRAAQEKLTDDNTKFHTSINEAFNSLDDKILEAQRQTDILRNDHLGALHKELELINHQSMSELAHSFDVVAKAADEFFADMKASWYQMGIGSEGAEHALTEFKVKYESLLAQGKDKDASDLLAGTLQSAKRILAIQQEGESFTPTGNDASDTAKYNELAANHVALKAADVGYSKKEVESQQALVDALSAQVGLQQKINTLKSDDRTNATLSAGKADGSFHEKQMMASLDDAAKQWEQEHALRQAAAKQAVDEETNKEDAVISVTREGSAARLNAIRDAMTEEENLGLAGTQHYQELLRQRNELAAKLDEEANAQRVEAAKEAAENDVKMGELRIAAQKQHMMTQDSGSRPNSQRQVAEASKIANEEYAVKMAALQKQAAGLDASGKDYQNKLKQLQNQEKQLTQQHEDELTAIKEKAEQQRNQRIVAAEQAFAGEMASQLTKTITGHQTWAHMIISTGDEVVSSLMQQAIKTILANEMTKITDAAWAARAAAKVGFALPGVGPVTGPLYGVQAEAVMLAFADGTDSVPGVGKGDIVSARLTPGEGVVPGGVMDGLRNMARNGGFSQQPSVTVHMRPTYHVQTIDGDGMNAALEKHSDQLQRHFESSLRKMNR